MICIDDILADKMFISAFDTPQTISQTNMINTLPHKPYIALILDPLIQSMPTSNSNEMTTLSDILHIFFILIVDQVVNCCVLTFDSVQHYVSIIVPLYVCLLVL